MKLLALITARGGSKRLPRKNVRDLGGKPLIAWSIEAAAGFDEIERVLVSTDDPEIKEASERFSGYVPWLRPEHLATDHATSVDVAIHALDWYEEQFGPVDGLILLQPTSPFRTKETIRRGINLFRENGRKSVIAVTPTHAHPRWTFRIAKGRLEPYVGEHGMNVRSQDLDPAFVVNGSLYIISGEELRENRSFFSSQTSALIVDSQVESLDIDTEFDWRFAEYCLQRGEEG